MYVHCRLSVILNATNIEYFHHKLTCWWGVGCGAGW
jgi:hypothetical protein